MASRPVSDEPPLAKERSSEMKARPMSQPEPGVPIFPAEHLVRRGQRNLVQLAQCLLDEADDDHRGQREDEEVGGDGEEAARLPDAAQVAVEQDEDDGRP